MYKWASTAGRGDTVTTIAHQATRPDVLHKKAGCVMAYPTCGLCEGSGKIWVNIWGKGQVEKTCTRCHGTGKDPGAKQV